jgi:hypothetical protein
MWNQTFPIARIAIPLIIFFTSMVILKTLYWTPETPGIMIKDTSPVEIRTEIKEESNATVQPRWSEDCLNDAQKHYQERINAACLKQDGRLECILDGDEKKIHDDWVADERLECMALPRWDATNY